MQSSHLAEILLLGLQARAITTATGVVDTAYHRQAELLVETLSEGGTLGLPTDEIEGCFNYAAEMVEKANAPFDQAVQWLALEFSARSNNYPTCDWCGGEVKSDQPVANTGFKFGHDECSER